MWLLLNHWIGIMLNHCLLKYRKGALLTMLTYHTYQHVNYLAYYAAFLLVLNSIFFCLYEKEKKKKKFESGENSVQLPYYWLWTTSTIKLLKKRSCCLFKILIVNVLDIRNIHIFNFKIVSLLYPAPSQFLNSFSLLLLSWLVCTPVNEFRRKLLNVFQSIKNLCCVHLWNFYLFLF